MALYNRSFTIRPGLAIRMMSVLVREDIDQIAHIQMAAPDRLNTLSFNMLGALQSEFDSIADDSSIRVVILSGKGSVFCAGHDLKEMIQRTKYQSEIAKVGYYTNLFRRCAKLMETIQRIPQPVIAQVHGVAVAAGCQLVATCDLAVAARGTEFGVNGINVGLFCTTPMVALLRRNLPKKRIFELLATGKLIAADEALAMGLVNLVVPVDELGERTQTFARTIASKLPTAIAIGKRAFYDISNNPISIADSYELATEAMVQNLLSEKTQEGIEAFLERGKRD